MARPAILIYLRSMGRGRGDRNVEIYVPPAAGSARFDYGQCAEPGENFKFTQSCAFPDKNGSKGLLCYNEEATCDRTLGPCSCN
jgi:hypothetical protein